MCVAVVGGMARLERRYVEEGRRSGIDVKVFNTAGRKLSERMRHVDAVVVFTDRVSHEARRLADRTAKASGVPVLRCHSCGLCALRRCFRRLREDDGRPA